MARIKARGRVYWLLERRGDNRAVYGPYSLGKAKAEKGNRYLIVRGDGLSDGTTMTDSETHHAIESGRFRIIA